MTLSRLLACTFALVSASALGHALPNQFPVASTGGNSGNDYVVDCNNVFSPGSAVTYVQLDGSASFDPDGTPVTFFWFEECPFGFFLDPTSPTPVFAVDMTSTCLRSCLMEVRVSSGGQTTKAFFRVTVQDATAPVLTAPANVLGIWGDATDTAAAGVATAADNCDPAPVITFTDVDVPQPGIGFPEKVIQRTWKVVDCTGLQSTAIQTISLLSPTGDMGFRANLDFDPANCPNAYAPLSTGTIDVLLLSGPGFDATKVVPGSLRLWVRTNPSVSILPSGVLLKDLGKVTAQSFGDCNSSVLDGKRDLRVRFSRATLASQLGLASYPSGQSLDIALTGRMKSGKVFATRDRVTIQ
ncbi:MAG TPA: hypothetical protein VM509_11305 [Planctomycetota bacterium]|nr:hypothetical protein [Planctomycetota bacterium]